MTVAWEPILDGKLADDARAAVLAVARALADGEGEPMPAADAAVFWAYVAGAFDDDWITASFDDAVAALPNAIDKVAGKIALFRGVCGIGFAMAHVSEAGAADEALAVIDDVVAAQLALDPWPDDHDLLRGLAGVGVYLLERGNARLLGRVVDHLVVSSETTDEGVAWFTAPERLPAPDRARMPGGVFNCGVAHGVPGVIALLGRLADVDPRARALAANSLRWLAAQRRGGHYPAERDRTGTNRTPARTAWCYGDPGVAITTWSAARRIGVATDDARTVARDVIARPLERCGIIDPGLCHGAAGLGHIYNRFYQASGETAFREAARDWLARALDLRRAEGLAGFATWSEDGSGEGHGRWRRATDLLEGAPGVALAMLAGLQPIEPAWDRLLLCDLPPRNV